ncbi:PASTA domain-containing protein [Kribbella sp. VKM Ac-2566]|uniref:PASTA domain-containing protein n=1 Tax=Kribbella sp. VKM Ac-2566 TaxID=2512218 RepID=UPI001063AF7D|nr:PASTA domain-containing protein [Kribbella sp. VKM Ac-2566]TDW89052.1 PASTA domain-containing protein [Kribbella sp. VKM Ac-2566]
MIETKLTELLEDTADHTPVGPPPLAAVRAGAARRRRRRTAGITGVTVVAVGAVIAGSSLLTSPTQTAPVTSPTPVPPPPAMRLVGFGHAAIAIPAAWPTNKSSCGTPYQDTVQIDDPSAVHLCKSDRPKGVESVQLTGVPPSLGYHADETILVDGVRAERQRTSCMGGWQGTRVCIGAVGIPSLKVWFYAESSTSAEDVDRILDRIQILRDRSGVPSYSSLGGAPTGPLARSYTPLLTAAGLKVQYKRVMSPSYPDGTILGVSPAVGTLLPVGSTVTVTVAG